MSNPAKHCGKKIINLRQLRKLMDEKKSVICPSTRAWCGHIPAAFMINQPGITLVQLFNTGMFVYETNRT